MILIQGPGFFQQADGYCGEVGDKSFNCFLHFRGHDPFLPPASIYFPLGHKTTISFLCLQLTPRSTPAQGSLSCFCLCRAGFFSCAITDILRWSFLVVKACPMCCRVFSSIPGLYPPDASSICDMKQPKVSPSIIECPKPPENHCLKAAARLQLRQRHACGLSTLFRPLPFHLPSTSVAMQNPGMTLWSR